jgi:RNA polymerase sigma factor (sigma-70 family)
MSATSIFSPAFPSRVRSTPSPTPVTALPRTLDRLLFAHATHDTDGLDAAWRAFVAEHTRLLLHVARSVTSSHDDAMDAYAFVIEQLQADDFRRLREFAGDPRSKLSTWLVVVARRLCLDLYRRRYGRVRGIDTSAQRAVRRRLQNLVGEDFDVHDLPATHNGGAELALRRSELQGALDQALATLDAHDQLLLRLRFDDDLSAQEIAKLLEFPSPFHVYRRVNTLLGVLRRALEQRGVESAVP